MGEALMGSQKHMVLPPKVCRAAYMLHRINPPADAGEGFRLPPRRVCRVAMYPHARSPGETEEAPERFLRAKFRSAHRERAVAGHRPEKHGDRVSGPRRICGDLILLRT